jgi:octaprenyl-diphosphate synthase
VDISRGNADISPGAAELSAVRNVPENAPWREIPSFTLIDSALRQVRELILQSLAARDEEQQLTPLFAHLRARGGKMLRPALVLLAGRCFGPLTDEHFRVAAILEMIHHATLLHDDVIDDGCKRRGLATVNYLWGNESAVLLGDFILSQVFRMAADLDPAMAKVISQTAVRVCEGELRQVVQRRNWGLSEAQYIDIITDKSAAFFSGCCRLGALLAPAQPQQVEDLARFGLLAGIAFQITDDLLDIAGDEDKTGKTAQSDLAQHKLTLAVIHLLRAVEPSGRRDVCAMLESPNTSRRKLEDLLTRYGSVQYARAQADDYVAQATGALQGVPAGKARDALVETARFMAHRVA